MIPYIPCGLVPDLWAEFDFKGLRGFEAEGAVEPSKKTPEPEKKKP